MVKIIAECIYTHDDDRYDNKTRAQQKCLKEEIMSPEYQVTKLMKPPPKDLQGSTIPGTEKPSLEIERALLQ